LSSLLVETTCGCRRGFRAFGLLEKKDALEALSMAGAATAAAGKEVADIARKAGDIL